MSKRILCVPEHRSGHGTGHIRRCLEIVDALGDGESGLLLPDYSSAAASLIPVSRRIVEPVGTYDLVVIDCRLVSRRLVTECSRFGPVIGIDAHGSGRKYCDYLIDMLPHPGSTEDPNLYDPGLLTSPKRIRSHSPINFERILLVFGGEDALGLSSRTAHRLVSIGIEPDRITALIGAAFAQQTFPQGIHFITNVRNAKELFADYDLVLTPFSLSMFEAAMAGCAVAGVHPSRYHRKLADRAGFFSIGVRSGGVRRLKAMLHNPKGFLPRVLRPRDTTIRSLPDFLETLTPLFAHGSPAVSQRCNPAILRTEQETFFRCRVTRVVYKQRFFPMSVHYNQAYFGDEYKKQYGRTYLEDFDSIRSVGLKRMGIINRLTPGNGYLLDLGCAYGPFLSAAQSYGWQPFGVDVSKDAVAWVQENLKIPAAHCDILNCDLREQFGRTRYNVVTLWYVIEHIPELGALLTRLNAILETGGICALSTPNGSGISARSRFSAFLLNGPEDHVTVFDPQHMQKLFGPYGFHVEKIRVTGHHPERFPVLGRTEAGRKIASPMSRMFGLGDTFELYARKTGAPLL